MKPFRFLLLLLAGLAAFGDSAADPWQFTSPIAVTKAEGPRVFHHLDSAGRAGIAVSGDWVAVVWEDNRDGVARCYAAFKARSAPGFSVETQVSDKDACVRPGVAALGRGRFAFGWEEGKAVHVRVGDSSGLGPALRLSTDQAAEIDVAPDHGNRFMAAWAEKNGIFMQIRYAALDVVGPSWAVHVMGKTSVEAARAKADQGYPSLTRADDGGIVLAWEDRRPGHTIIMATRSISRGHFAAPAQINESTESEIGYGAGTGAARVVLGMAGKRVVAVWTDKRDFTQGNDVYAALSADQGAHFGKNERVQDSLGDTFAQWHPALATDAKGQIVVAFDDDRDGTSDIWLAWRTPSGWSDNLALPGGSGPGEQSDPVIAIDDAGALHVAWIERDDVIAPTRLRYAVGEPTTTKSP
jgi:hypothetical protein